MPLMFKTIADKGISARGLGDYLHWSVPGWRDFLEMLGTVPGTRGNVRALFDAGEDLLVYPGGGNELFKPSTVRCRYRLCVLHCAICHESPPFSHSPTSNLHFSLLHFQVPRYSLMWKSRTGFARCAIQSGATIIPCCSVGTEEMLRTVADINVDFVRKGMIIPAK